jgi:hypothetical protein
MATPSDDYTLQELVRDLNRKHGSEDRNAVSFSRLWRSVVSTPDLGRKIAGRWSIPRANLTRVEAMLGLPRDTTAA